MKLFNENRVKIQREMGKYNGHFIFKVWKLENGAWIYERAVVADTYKEAYETYVEIESNE